MADIIVVDDDERTCRSLCRFLTFAGHDVRSAGSADELDAALAQRRPDVVLLDIGLPGERGTSIARRVRERTDARIVMVTGISDKKVRQQAAANGADHYLVKPIDVDELGFVIDNLLRRRGERSSSPVSAGGWTLADGMRRLSAPDGRSVDLTMSEHAILFCLAQVPGETVRREVLATRLGYQPGQPLNGIEAIVARLRRKVERDTGQALPLKSARGIGYLFTGRIVVRG